MNEDTTFDTCRCPTPRPKEQGSWCGNCRAVYYRQSHQLTRTEYMPRRRVGDWLWDIEAGIYAFAPDA